MRNLGRIAHNQLSLLIMSLLMLVGCGASVPDEEPAAPCEITRPVLAQPPDDPAVDGPAAPGLYFLNAERTIWASAWWYGEPDHALEAGAKGNKIGWFRPAGAELVISGRRLDAPAGSLEAHVPCCYPTQFQATGLTFPTPGCWEVNAHAADSSLSFVVEVRS